MLNSFPKTIDLFCAIKKQKYYEGNIVLSSLFRLHDKAKNSGDSISFGLGFNKVAGIGTIDGFVRGIIKLECQNCLQLLEFEVDSAIKLAIVQSGKEALIPDDYEPLLCNQEKIILTDIVEDEILLSIPGFPKHRRACFKKQAFGAVVQASKDSPFSILATIKKLEFK